jgi:hypothetical protein
VSAASEIDDARTINGAYGKDLGRPIGVPPSKRPIPGA